MFGHNLPKGKVTESPTEKDKFDIAIEKEINTYIDSLNLEAEFSQNLLVSPAMRRAKIMQEMKSGIDLSELGSHIVSALTILISQGKQYLDSDVFREMADELATIGEKIEEVDLSQVESNKFHALLGISDSSMASILKIAAAKYQEQDYVSALSIFALLSTLDSSSDDYWFRLGITAERNENYLLALRAYAAASELNPHFVGSHLFSIECHLRSDNVSKAKEEFQIAKQILDSEEVDPMWRELLPDIEKALKDLS